jgi:alkanesulfonate monooxygenase SsuD/methylene tetrahydromethanopterin reductase-like flavin-dependent oxidoreductase (luciferase family)
MRLGLFMMPLHPPTRTLGAFLEETAEKALLAERLGFDEVWLGEHFSATSEPIPSPLMFMASLVPQTKRITFATGVINLPNRHPAVIAAEVAQFDHMSEGRFIFGIGTGSLPSDYELFDIADAGQRQRMMLESISFIERIWAQGPPYELNGEFWRFAIKKAISEPLGIGIMPKPRRVGGPPICVAVSSPGSPTARIAGARGWGPVTSGLTSVDAAARTGSFMKKVAVRLVVSLMEPTGVWSSMCMWRARTPRHVNGCTASKARTDMRLAISTRCSSVRAVWLV